MLTLLLPGKLFLLDVFRPKLMTTYDTSFLSEQIASLAKELNQPLPYKDCHRTLQDAVKATPNKAKRFRDFTPDLSTYFSYVYSHASGVEHIISWQSSRLTEAQLLLKKSFFTAYPAYKPLEWRVNQLNTPTLYREIAASDQLRNLLLELLSQLIAERREANMLRQKHFLSAA